MSRIYVFTASEMEARPVLELASLNGAGEARMRGIPFRVGSNELNLIVGGMGPQRAKASAAEALRSWAERSGSGNAACEQPDFVLITGLCGGLTRSLPERQIVTYTNCLSSEVKRLSSECSASITRRLPELLNLHGISCQSVVGITTPQIAVRKADREALARSGASVVDMESYEILAVAVRARVPAAVLRVVGDSYDWELPDFNRALDAHGTLNGRKALQIALGSPLRTLRLLAANKQAMRQLTRALRIVLLADWPMH